MTTEGPVGSDHNCLQQRDSRQPYSASTSRHSQPKSFTQQARYDGSWHPRVYQVGLPDLDCAVFSLSIRDFIII